MKPISIIFRSLGWVGLAFLFLLASAVHAQPPDTLWTRVHPLPEISYFDPGGMVEMSDGGLSVCAAYSRLDETHSGFYLLRFDSLGELQWHHPMLDSAVGVLGGGFCRLGENRFVAAGCKGVQFNIHAAAVDSLGMVLWARTYDLPDHQMVVSVCAAPDGDPVVACKTVSPFGPDETIMLIKLEAESGDTLWTSRASIREHRVWARSIIRTQDDGFAIVGYAAMLGQAGAVLLMKFDSRGELEFYRTYRLGDDNYGYDIAQRPDRSFIICGVTQFWQTGVMSGFALHVGANGDSLWSWQTPIDDGLSDATRVVVLHEAGFILLHSGIQRQSVSGFNAVNERMWRSDIGLPGPYTFYVDRCVTVGRQDRISAVARSYDNIHGYPFVAVVRTESVSLDVDDNRHVGRVQELELSTYPNPFNSTLSISLTIPPHQETTVALYDLLGREVDVIYRGRLTNSTISYRAPAGLASGIYFVRATGEGTGAVMRKVVLLK